MAQNLKAYGSPSGTQIAYGKWNFTAGTGTDTVANVGLLNTEDRIRISAVGANTYINLIDISSTSAANRGIVKFTRARGTSYTSLSSVAASDIAGTIQAAVWTGSQIVNSASYDFFVDGTPSATYGPLAHRWFTQRAAVAATESMRLTSDGRLGVGAVPLSNTTLQINRNQNAANLIYVSNNNASTAAQAGVRVGNDSTTASGSFATISMLGSGFTPAGVLKGLTTIFEGNGSNMLISNLNTTEPIQFTTGSSRTERMRLTTDGRLQINMTTGANPTGLYVNRSVAIEKDSVTIAPSMSGMYLLLIDTTATVDSNRIKRISPSSLGGATIYTGNSSLSSDRTVTGSGFDLTFTTLDNFVVNSNYSAIAKNDGSYIYTSRIGATSDNYLQIAYTPTIVGGFTKGTALVIDTNNNVLVGNSISTAFPTYTGGNTLYASNLVAAKDNYLGFFVLTSNASITKGNGFRTYLVDATSGNITITLPNVSDVSGGAVGIVYNIKRIDNSGNTVTIQAQGSDLIDGAASISLSTQWDSREIQACGSNRWMIL